MTITAPAVQDPRRRGVGQAVWLRSGLRHSFFHLPSYLAIRLPGISGGSMRVVVEGGGKRIELSGGQFDRKKVEWIRDMVLHLAGRLY